MVKCHQSRLLQQNQKLARTILIKKLDNLINGESSVDAQQKAINHKKSIVNHHKKQNIRILKETWKNQIN